MKKIQPKSVKRINCSKYGELQVKIYPYSSMQISGEITPCTKCQGNPKLFVPDLNRLGLVER